jgi:hypothetical protein
VGGFVEGDFSEVACSDDVESGVVWVEVIGGGDCGFLDLFATEDAICFVRRISDAAFSACPYPEEGERER